MVYIALSVTFLTITGIFWSGVAGSEEYYDSDVVYYNCLESRTGSSSFNSLYHCRKCQHSEQGKQSQYYYYHNVDLADFLKEVWDPWRSAAHTLRILF
jgi:hypothetical protein